MDYQALRQRGPRSQRWLSLPYSRLIINPYNFDSGDHTHPEYSDRPTLPLNLGYLDPYSRTGSGVWLEDLIAVREQADQDGCVRTQFATDFAPDSTWASSAPAETELALSDGRLALTVKRSSRFPWQNAYHRVSLDLDAHPQLIITVDSCNGGRWAVKMCADGEQQDTVVIGDKITAGTYTCDLCSMLGRTGRYEGVVRLFAVGYDQTLTVSHLEISEIVPAHREADEFAVEWTPAALEQTAHYAGGLALSLLDTFADEATVLRCMSVTTPGSPVLVGRITGKATLADNTLIVDCGGYTYAISADRPLTLGFHRDLRGMLTDKQGAASPEGCTHFTAALGHMEAGERITLAVTILSDATPAAEVAARCRTALQTSAEAARAAHDAYWTDYLARVPQPAPATLDHIDPMGVTPDQLEQMYLIGWVFLAQNLLPENPELDYPYTQVCCGKPSMWAYGDAKSAYSASWESFFGMQLLGLVMPDAAWSALEGLLSLVEEDGMLGGESLPSEKAHTAWVLYRHTGDLERLRGVYDALDRYLCWRIQNPRWIYLEHNDPACADADFVVSALLDIEYMQKIAAALGRDADAALWKERYDAFLQDYYRWCFDENGFAHQVCDKHTLKRSQGHPVWVTKGLLIEALDRPHEQMLMRRLTDAYRDGCAFGGLDDVVKYPVYSQTVLGLHRIGERALARKLVEMSLRDIVRVGMFSENYSGDPMSVPTGVRPSMFGCAMMLDSTLLLGGFSSQLVDNIEF